jgi:Ca2+-binding RTX toxin-like protein
MASSIGHAIFVDRASGAFDINVDYTISGYFDPETGEAFSETSYGFSYYDPALGTAFSGGGYGGESNSVVVNIGYPSGEAVANADFTFSAINNFTNEGTSLGLHIVNAGLGYQDKVLIGTAGTDIVLGGSGNDLLRGEAGADYLDGGAGIDRMIGGSGDDLYQVDASGDKAIELEDGGEDIVVSAVSYVLGANVEQLILNGFGALNGIGNDGANLIYGNQDVNDLRGAGGDDQLYGYDGDDRLYGGGGDDLLDGGSGGDRMEGGIGDDHFVIDNAADRIVERPGEGRDEARVLIATYTLGAGVEDLTNIGEAASFKGLGNSLANLLTGNAWADELWGLEGADTLNGGGGDDLLLGGLGADVLNGGSGIDTASYSRATTAVRVNLERPQVNGGEASGDTYVSVENVIGSAFADTLNGDALANRIDGGAGDDILFGGDGDDWLVGGAGADQLNGGAGLNGVSYAGSKLEVTVNLGTLTATGGDATGDTLRNFINAEGGSGRDTLIGDNRGNLLIGGGGRDMLDGGTGNDTLRGGAGPDQLFGGAGTDIIDYAGSSAAVTVSLATNTATGGDAQGDTFSGIEGVTGSALADRLSGDSGADAITGGAGDDTILAGDGNDTVIGGAGADITEGGIGLDTLSYAGSTDNVQVFLEGGWAFGGDGSGDRFSGFENLRGGEVSDGLYGDSGNNRIEGGAGGDYIRGGGGTDKLIGGTGDDAFYFGPESQIDRVLDFTAGGAEDRINFDPELGYSSFQHVMSVARQSGSDTVFTFGPDHYLVLENVTLGSLTVDDFLFQ